MSTFPRRALPEYEPRRDFNVPELDLLGGTGTIPKPILGGFVANTVVDLANTLVDRMALGILDVGTGRTLFGTTGTPQAGGIGIPYTKYTVGGLYNRQGWDYDVAKNTADPSWSGERGRMSDAQRSAVMYLGGPALEADLRKNTTSLADWTQRLDQLEFLARARIAVDEYDRSSGLVNYATTKTTSALINYVFSDPITTVSTVMTAGLAGGLAGGAAAGRAGAVAATQGGLFGARFTSLVAANAKSFRAATYLWDTLDGASSGYSGYVAMNEQQKALFGSTGHIDTNPTDDVLIGAGLGVVFSAAGDVLGAVFKKNNGRFAEPKVGLDAAEDLAVKTKVHGATEADAFAQNQWFQSKSRLERALDTTEGPTSDTRRVLMDDELRENLGLNSAREMDALSDFIEKNKPSAEELGQFVNDRMTVAASRDAASRLSADEIDELKDVGGNINNLFAKRAHDLLRNIMGDQYSAHRFIIKQLEELTGGNMAQVANWMARADKEQIGRFVNALNESRRRLIESDALDRADLRIREARRENIRARDQWRTDSFRENIRQGKWTLALRDLDNLHAQASAKAGQRLAEIDGAINELQEVFNKLPKSARRKLGRWTKANERLVELVARMKGGVSEMDAARREVKSALGEDATVADVLSLAQSAAKMRSFGVDNQLGKLEDEIIEILSGLKRDTDEIEKSLARVASLQGEIGRLSGAGRSAIDRIVTVIKDFPSIEVEFSLKGYESTMRMARHQVRASNRWRLDLIDRTAGIDMADNALEAGVSPMRPVSRLAPEPSRLSVDDLDRILNEELARIDPEIQALRAAATDLPLDQRIATNLDAAKRLRDTAAKAEAMAAKSSSPKPYQELAKKKNRAAKRLETLAKRQEKQLQGQLDVLNADVSSKRVDIVTVESLAAARRDAARVSHTKAAMELSSKTPEQLANPNGLKLRDKVRRLAAEVDGGTDFQVTTRERAALQPELDAARKSREVLERDGSTTADPKLKTALAQEAHLEKKLKAIDRKLDGINNRPAAMRRTAALSGPSPKASDVMDLTRLRVRAAQLLKDKPAGWQDEFDDIASEVYAKYGDTSKVSRWKELEDIMGEDGAEIVGIRMDGRNVVVSVKRQKADPDAIFAKEVDITAKIEKGVDTATPEGRASLEARRKTFERARKATNAEIEPKPDTGPEFETTDITIAPGTPAKLGEAAPAKVEPAAPDPSLTPKEAEAKAAEEAKKAAIDSWLDSAGGDRLLLSSAVINAAQRIPVLRPLGRAMFRAIGAGTQFARFHNVSRSLDVLVKVFNLIDSPEAVVKSLGSRGAGRTLESARTMSLDMANKINASYGRLRGQFDAGWQGRMREARSTGNLDALNPAEREMYNELVSAMDRIADARKAAGLPVIENFFPREARPGVLHRHSERAQRMFAEVIVDRMREADTLPAVIRERFGLSDRASFAALSPDLQEQVLRELQTEARIRAKAIVRQLSNGLVDDGAGGTRFARTRFSDVGNRSLEDGIVNDPRLAEFYIENPVEAANLYLQHRAPRHLFDANLSHMFGFPVSYRELMEAAQRRIVDADLPIEVAQEAGNAFKALETRYRYLTGQVDYAETSLLKSGFFRAGSALIKSTFGSMWGLAGAVTEVPRSVLVSQMYGGSMARGIGDLLYAIRNSNNLDAAEDIAHGIDQYTVAAHSGMGSNIGLTAGERLMAPWQRFWNVARGAESLMEGSQAYGRVAGSAIAGLEALGQSATRLGGLQAMSGVARVVADRQAKRWISSNLKRMRAMQKSLAAIGGVTEQTPEAIARFNRAADEAGIPRDLAIRLNNSGLLQKEVLDQLDNVLKGREGQVFMFRQMRDGMNDEGMTALMNFMQEVHNFAVPVQTLATTVASGDVTTKAFYMLTSYARAMSLNVAFRSAATGNLANTLSLFAFMAVGENLYQSIRSYAMGKKSIEDIEQEYRDNPAQAFFKNALKTPYLGAHTGSITGVVGSMTGLDTPLGGQGQGLLDPTIQLFKSAQSKLFSNEPLDDKTVSIIQNLSPGINAWYTRLMTRTALEN